MNCDYCGKRLENPKPNQRFCSWAADTHCRQKWHHEHQLPGVVKVVRKLKHGKWTVTIHYSDDPKLNIDQRVAWLETEPKMQPKLLAERMMRVKDTDGKVLDKMAVVTLYDQAETEPNSRTEASQQPEEEVAT